ncbi:hypothetical protein PA598K_03051 [Paenibacillus sp. 598K]|uniref:Imm51 family immunity protein n=1 Tax=Paenibacillus sp. 598K TaxID=1117987 RepID=UPI000FFA8B7E|nr:Imm51 family immunity protein [Paenibacillus sp. 598K]GBF74689.1 hypothetical protein PA598K_03051 [Paenibacillus sp. 598K]
MKADLLKKLNVWYGKQKHEAIVAELTTLPEEELDAELIGHLARAHNNIGNYDEAIRLLLTVQEQGATDALWQFRLGYAYYYSDRYQEALPCFEEACRLEPKDALNRQFLDMTREHLNLRDIGKSASKPKTKKVSVSGLSRTAETAAPIDKNQFAPFKWIVHDRSVSLILTAGSYKQEVFAEREDEGFEGNGYDWGSLAAVFIKERMPKIESVVHFDPEADMFCAYSEDSQALARFAAGFLEACEDDAVIRDLFSRAELD